MIFLLCTIGVWLFIIFAVGEFDNETPNK